ncbi:methyltransferase domain-containing protein [Streptomyces longisporoflavus]|uniref:Methyltransferase domain-containing protein n=1 Tax=Streptomyces longisporoflavus TaxID=28044 RepID=A0ABW7R515_9ACTN
MSTTVHQHRPGRSELGRALMSAGALTSEWAPTFAAVDRAAFLPDVIWPYDLDTGAMLTLDRRENPRAWYAHVDTDIPIVTQWDDGHRQGPGPGTLATSSSSMPSVVYRMLADLDVQPGMTVFDGGTGSGESAAALTHRLGPGAVTTAEVDAAVAWAARERLCATGLYAHCVQGDATSYVADAVFDRVLITFGLRHFGRLVRLTKTGGVIVAPFGTHYTTADAVIRLTVHGTRAEGHFVRSAEFMKARAQRAPEIVHEDYVAAVSDGDKRTAAVREDAFTADRFGPADWAVGLRVRDVIKVVADKRDGARPVWLYGTGDKSWACAFFRDDAPTLVWQHGPRRLWDEVEAALAWWTGHGRPAHERFGLTVTPDGTRAWLDTPTHSWPL